MTTAYFDIPYFFDAEYVPKGKRKQVEAVFGGMLKVGIDSVTSEEAPIAVTVRRTDRFTDVTRDFVEHKGAFYSSQKGDFDRPSQKEVLLADFTPAHLDHHTSWGIQDFIEGETPELPEDVGYFYSIEGKRHPGYWGDSVEEAKEEVRQSAAKVIFVDGVLHYQCELPTILTKITYSHHSDAIYIDLGRSDPETGALGAMFAIDEHASALAWAQDRQARESTCSIRDYVTVEVHNPHLIARTDICKTEAVRFCKYLFDHVDDLKEKTDGYLTDFMLARRFLFEAIHFPTDEKVSEMLDAWEDLMRNEAVLKDARNREFGSSYDLDDNLNFKALMGMKAAWDNRPVTENEIDFGSGMPTP